MNYDIIGDVHGHADVLVALLRKLGYREQMGAWRHTERTAVFVGDFIDRGPRQVESVMVARRMVDAGTAVAVMGNHELMRSRGSSPILNRPASSCDRTSPRDGEAGTGSSTRSSFERWSTGPSCTRRSSTGS